MRLVKSIKEGTRISDYTTYAALLPSVMNFRSESELLKNHIKDRCIWMINSTEQGGGVAEMLPRQISFLRQLGLRAEWAVMETEEADFFAFTKKVHNLIHGSGDPYISRDEIALYEKINRENAESFIPRLKKGDIVVIHDPQPAAMIQQLSQVDGIITVWRCHIGLDQANAQTDSAWAFLEPYLMDYDHFVFSAPEYIPEYLSGNIKIIYPSIDPLSHKNRELSIHKLSAILCNAGLARSEHPLISDGDTNKAKIIQPDGSFVSADQAPDIGLLHRPIISQVSRWDYLKGFHQLMQAFVHLKNHVDEYCDNPRDNCRIQYARLLMAGPDPDYVSDDPEGVAVLNEMITLYQQLPESLREDIIICKLPMDSVKENALIVNAIQRCSYIVCQNSLQEGFGLTATEAMWKTTPLVSSNACGLRHQLRHEIDGLRVSNPTDRVEVADALFSLISQPKMVEEMGFHAQKRVVDHFLIFSQVLHWLRLFDELGRKSEKAEAGLA